MPWIDDMTAAAAAVLDSVGPAALALDDGRRDWTYLPVPRRGARLGDLTQDQRNLVHRLLAVAASDEAYAQLCAVVSLEDVLDLLEGRDRGRNSGNYWLAVYGRPGDDRWAWSFEGHHVSVNVTVAGGRVAATPFFLGANPHQFAIRPLGGEEDLARATLAAMTPRTRQQAVIADAAPDDILTQTRAEVGEWELQPLGVAGRDLDADARARLAELVNLYTGRVRHAPAGPSPADVHFAWAGDSRPGEPHYYRLQGPGFLVEYDNTQNGANHSHTVWRVPGGDFGDDILLRHHEEDHS